MLKNTAKIIETNFFTGYGLMGSSNTSNPESKANALMYGTPVYYTIYYFENTYTENLKQENYFLSERDFQLLNDVILNPPVPNDNLMDMFSQYSQK